MNEPMKPQESTSDSASRDAIGWNLRTLAQATGGCLAVTGSAVLSCVLLLVNAALMMAILAAAEAAGVVWMQTEGAAQLVLFAGPVAVLIIQWMMIDYLRAFVRS